MGNDTKTEMYDSSVRLCRAVQGHTCVYDRDQRNSKASEAAWEVIAKQCGDTVESCKSRWRHIRSAFIRSRQGSSCRTRSSNRTREYYLHDVLEFYLPYLPLSATSGEGDKSLDSENESCGTSTAKAEPASAHEDKEVKHKNDSEKQEAEETTSAEETAGEEEKQELKTEETTPLDTSKIRTFYIKHKPTKVGTFIIKEHREEEPATTAEGGPSPKEREGGADETNLDDDEDDEAHRFRFRRACKRNLDKTMVRELRVRKREPELKRVRRSNERVRAIAKTSFVEDVFKHKTPLKLTLAREPVSGGTESVELKAPQQQTKHERQATPAKSQVQHVLLPSDVMETQAQLGETPQEVWYKQYLDRMHNTQPLTSTPIVPIPDLLHAKQLLDQSVQCELLSSTVALAKADDDFLNMLRPQMLDMNARQKLNFKRKVYAALMEVFDDAADFPRTGDTPTSVDAGLPHALPASVTNTEVQLMRELVALVQAAKQTPEVLESPVAATSPPVVSAAQQLDRTPSDTPPLMTAAAIGVQPRSAAIYRIGGNVTPHTDGIMDVPRHLMRKVIKLTPNARDGDKRRIYRVYPGSSTIAATGPSGVGTFIIPRMQRGTPTAGVANTRPSSASAAGDVFSNMELWATDAAATAALNATASPAAAAMITPPAPPATKNERFGPGMPRHLLRRYSICGAGTVSSAGRRTPTKVLTTSANLFLPPLTTYTTAGPGGTTRRFMRTAQPVPSDKFKVPHSIAVHTTHTTASATTTKCTATASTSKGAAALCSLPGFNHFLTPQAPAQSQTLTTAAALTPNKPTAKTSTSSSASPLLSARKQQNTAPPIATVPNKVVVQPRPNADGYAHKPSADGYAHKPKNEGGAEQTTCLIASDNFGALNIKNEPMDEAFL